MNYEQLEELYQSTMSRVLSSDQEYLRYLNTAIQLYKYPLEDQLLIYAQIPNPTAVATIHQWNRIGRYVDVGTVGAYHFTTKSSTGISKELFDIRNTHGAPITPHAWQLPSDTSLSALFHQTPNSSPETEIEQIVRGQLESVLKRYAKKPFFSSISLSAFLSATTCYIIGKRLQADISRWESEIQSCFTNNALKLHTGAAVLSLQIATQTANNILLETERSLKYEHNYQTRSTGTQTYDRVRNSTFENFKRRISTRKQSTLFPRQAYHPCTSSRRRVMEHAADVNGKVHKQGNTKFQLSGESERAQSSAINRKRTNRTGNSKEANSHTGGSNNQQLNLFTLPPPSKSLTAIMAEDWASPEQDETNKTTDSEEVDSKELVPITVTETVVPSINEHNEIHDSALYSFRTHHDSGLFESGAKARFQKNIAAIKTCMKLEAGGTPATAEELKVMNQYAGWGGIPEAFDPSNPAWEKEYSELQQLLPEADYQAARSSTLTAFYTPLPIMEYMYQALEQFGFQGGRIIDPAMGTGRFFGAIPESMRDSILQGVEIDSISAKIAKQLYQKANIRNCGFEETRFQKWQFDVAIGNVPFGDFSLPDGKYDKYNFQIHDYFFAKSADLIRPGGMIAYITTSGTMDKKDTKLRAYLAERCDLVGAIRLPENTFSTTGTKVTSDILFLQVRQEQRDLKKEKPEWLATTELEHGVRINSYFQNHPEMIMGELKITTGRFGYELRCLPKEQPLEELLTQTLAWLNTTIPVWEQNPLQNILPSTEYPHVKPYMYAVVDKQVYYREYAEYLSLEELSQSAAKRITLMDEMRYILYHLLQLQSTGEDSQQIRSILNAKYDSFVANYGPLNSPTNYRLFSKDIECNFLMALEEKTEQGYQKTDIFHQQTVSPVKTYETVQTAHEGLLICLDEKGHVDIPYIAQMIKKSDDEVLAELEGVIFQNPEKYHGHQMDGWELADEYLSGNVRAKKKIAELYEQKYPNVFSHNISALEQVLPTWLEAGEIHAKLGAVWIPTEYYTQFMGELFETPRWLIDKEIFIHYNHYDSRWTIEGKGRNASIKTTETFGTARVNAYYLLQDCLNNVNTTVKDKKDENTYIVNPLETQIARTKQEEIKQAFADWIFRTPERRKYLETHYNELFNSLRPRNYNGEYLQFPGLSTQFTPYTHQRNAVARIIDSTYHTLLDHKVGAGKTATMIMGAWERLRLGLSKRVLFIVPNHIVGQFGKDIYKLYPTAKAAIATEKDFEKKNRQQFLSRIAYSDVQMIVIGHTQFEKIPLPNKFLVNALKKESEDLTAAALTLEKDNNQTVTVKQIKKKQKEIETQIVRLLNTNKKDSGITNIEQMGIDTLVVDEADMFKNCYVFTKLRNVAGVGQAASQRAADMLSKCRYITEKKGKIVFATGTPVSNSVSELYVIERYLQEPTLHNIGIHHFDEWVANYAEVTTSFELAPEGNGFRQRTRLSKYFNLPELMARYSLVADVQTAETLHLNVPKLKSGEPEIIVCKPSEELLCWIENGVARCENIRNRRVRPEEDNMLKFTLEAKLAGLDLRILEPDTPFDPNGKIATCANNIAMIYHETEENKGVQLVFCDSSTPNKDRFNVYDEVKRILTEQGIPPAEIAYIHDAKNNKQKEEIFRKCRNGEVRILLGSTEKCGAGTNIQDRLYALHHLDCPYRPRDIEQREGRIIRQGNQYPEVRVLRYVTEKSFDAYLWNIIATKQRFISQLRQGNLGQRTFEEQDETLLSFEAVKAIATGDPRIMKKIELDNEVSRLQLLYTGYQKQRYRLEDALMKNYPWHLQHLITQEKALKKDVERVSTNKSETFSMILHDIIYDEQKAAGEAIIKSLALVKSEPLSIGTYCGFEMKISPSLNSFIFQMSLVGTHSHTVEINADSPIGTIKRIDNLLHRIAEELSDIQAQQRRLQKKMDDTKLELEKPFAYGKELEEAKRQQKELTLALNLDREEEMIQEDTNTQTEEEILEQEAEESLQR